MGRHGILRNLKKPGDFACRDPIRFSARQKAKGLQPSMLSERGEACNGLSCFHISSFVDIYDGFKTGFELTHGALDLEWKSLQPPAELLVGGCALVYVRFLHPLRAARRRQQMFV